RDKLVTEFRRVLFRSTDYLVEAHAMVSLVDQGWASQVEVARTFNCSTRTVRRNQRRFEESGLAALGQPRGYPPGRPRLTGSRRRSEERRVGKERSCRS